ncbi:MAG: hypothetical protein GTO41_24020 [Burkholderiales bacterium]|nr:hypothetical protein [Burkholderiales bacterium]
MSIPRNISIVLGLFALLLLIIPADSTAQDMLKICINCHGEDGLGKDSDDRDTPIIAGEKAAALEDALYAYLDGARTCVSAPMMCKSVARLTEEQISEYAAHFSALPYKPAGEDFDAALAAAGESIHKANCAKCHGADHPSEADADIGASMLHGQRKNYLRQAMQQYASGEREQLPAMEEKLSALSAADVDALLEYYASYRCKDGEPAQQ